MLPSESAGRRDYDPQPPPDEPLCEATRLAQHPNPGHLTLGGYQVFSCTRTAGHGSEKHYHPELGWWDDPDPEGDPF